MTQDGQARSPGTVTALRRPPVRESIVVRSGRRRTFETFVRIIGVGVEAEKAVPELVAARIVAALAAGETVVFPDDASAGAGSVYLSDPLKLEQLLTG